MESLASLVFLWDIIFHLHLLAGWGLMNEPFRHDILIHKMHELFCFCAFLEAHIPNARLEAHINRSHVGLIELACSRVVVIFSCLA